MKIAIVVHGRFHAFDLARTLLERGHDLTVFSNYPAAIARRFGIPGHKIRSFLLHGVISRVAWKLRAWLGLPYREDWFHVLFTRWAAQKLSKEHWDVIHCFSGVAEEILRSPRDKNCFRVIVRGSSHIRTQARILEEEEERAKLPVERPGAWIIAREEREYQLADRIVVLSRFALNSFVAEGITPEKLLLLPLGVRIKHFQASPEVIEARCARILSGEPLRVLYVGALSLQKGMWDLAEVIQTVGRTKFVFRLVGPASPEMRVLRRRIRPAEIFSKQPQWLLPRWYSWGDVFIFPTLQDGFAGVLNQALASGLPLLATTNCGAPDIVREGQTGWILPIRSPQAFAERLEWCDTHREELAAMVRRMHHQFQPEDWACTASRFEQFCENWRQGQQD